MGVWFARRKNGRAGDWWVNSSAGTLGFVVWNCDEPKRARSMGTPYWEAFDRDGNKVGERFSTRKQASEALQPK